MKEAEKKYEEEKKYETENIHLQSIASHKILILLQPQNRKHFENFVAEYDKIIWPEHHLYFRQDVDGTLEQIEPSDEQANDYETELAVAVEAEKKLCSFYSKFLKSKNIIINNEVFSYVVDLYKKNHTVQNLNKK